jgi:hypothetical protein
MIRGANVVRLKSRFYTFGSFESFSVTGNQCLPHNDFTGFDALGHVISASDLLRWRNTENLQSPSGLLWWQIRSIDGEVKRKHLPQRWNFSCFQPHAIKLGVFWPAAPSARMLAVQQFRFSLSAVFIALRDEASPL